MDAMRLARWIYGLTGRLGGTELEKRATMVGAGGDRENRDTMLPARLQIVGSG